MAIQQILSSNQWYLVPECNNLSQKAMAELFGVQTPAISKHLKNIFSKENWMTKWLLQKLQRPLNMGQLKAKRKQETLNSTTPKPSSPSAIGSIHIGHPIQT